MIKILPLLFSLFWLLAAPCAIAAPAFWKIAEPGSAENQGEVYVFGSFHLLKADSAWLTPEVDSRFKTADRLMLETNADDMQADRMQQLVRRHAVYPMGIRLQDRLPFDLWIQLENVMGRMGQRTNNMQLFKPWYAALVASVQFAQSLGFSPEEGVDRYFLERAQAMGKPVEGLETAEEQLAFFFNQSEQVQIRFLEDTLRQIEQTPSILSDMTQSWIDGDLKTMEKLIVTSMKKVPEVYEALLVDRNRQWVDRMAALTKRQGTTFVVVGAAHLIGDDSLLTMLAREGFAVTRIDQSVSSEPGPRDRLPQAQGAY